MYASLNFTTIICRSSINLDTPVGDLFCPCSPFEMNDIVSLVAFRFSVLFRDAANQAAEAPSGEELISQQVGLQASSLGDQSIAREYVCKAL